MKNPYFEKNFTSIVLISACCGLSLEILRLILPLSIYELHQSTGDVSLFRAVWFLPNVLFAIFVGVVNDRMRKTFSLKLFIFLQFLIVVVILMFYPSAYSGLIYILLLSFIFVTANYSYLNAQSGFIQKTVARENIIQANSILRTISSSISVIGPLLTGYFVASGQLKLALVMCAVLLMLALGFSFALRLEEQPARSPFVKALTDGFHNFRGNRPLLIMTLAVMLVNGTEGIYAALLIPYISGSIDGSSFDVGVVFSITGLGCIAGAAVTPAVRNWLGMWTTFTLPIALTGLLYLALSFTSNLVLICVIGFLEGLISSIMVIAVWSYRQETTPTQFIGRVVGITGSVFKLGMPVMIIMGGYYAEIQSLTSAFFLIGALNIVICATVFYLAQPYMKGEQALQHS